MKIQVNPYFFLFISMIFLRCKLNYSLIWIYTCAVHLDWISTQTSTVSKAFLNSSRWNNENKAPNSICQKGSASTTQTQAGLLKMAASPLPSNCCLFNCCVFFFPLCPGKCVSFPQILIFCCLWKMRWMFSLWAGICWIFLESNHTIQMFLCNYSSYLKKTEMLNDQRHRGHRYKSNVSAFSL